MNICIMWKQILKRVGMVLAVSLGTTLLYILPDFFDSLTEGVEEHLLVAFYVSALLVSNFFVVLLLMIERHVFAVLFPLYCLVGSAVAYYRVAYHVTVTPIIIDTAIHTNPSEAAGVMSVALVVWLAVNVIMAGAVVWWRWRQGRWEKGWIYLLIGVVSLPFYYTINSRLQTHINQRYPYNIVYSTIQYLKLQKLRHQALTMLPYREVGEPSDSLQVVLVLGESERADHFSLNGYERKTNPHLEKETNLVTLRYVYSEHTHTLASLPHILTPADSLHPDRVYYNESLIPYFEDRGFYTAWISNQDLGATYAHYAMSADTSVFCNGGKSPFVFSHWDDMELLCPLRQLQEQVDSTTGRGLYVMHCIGSHWYYNTHLPEGYAPYQPVTVNRTVTANAPERVVNAYDNTIVYLDSVLYSMIELFRDKEAVIIFQSDHGESLGENGNWLHAAGAEETKYPAACIWYSDRYAAKYPEMVEEFKGMENSRLRTDYVFPLLLKVGGMELIENE